MGSRAALHFALLSLILLFFIAGRPGEQSQSSTEMVRQAPVYITTDFPWEMFHHDPQHRGYSQTVAPATNNLLWGTATGGAVYSSPAVVDGIVYIGSSDTLLYALNESSGGVLWTWKTGAPATASPAVGGGTVYIPSQDRTLYAVNAKTGQLRWSSVQTAPLTSSPTLADRMVFFGTQYSPTAGTAQILSLNSSSGATVWTFNWAASITSSPTIDQGRVFVGTTNGWVLALDEMSGRLIWQYLTGTSQVSTPAVVGDYLYVSTTGNKILALDRLTGVLRWSQSFGGPANPTPSTPAVGVGRVVFGTGKNQIVALNATTGTSLWTHTTGGAVSSSPALSLDTVLAGSNDNKLYAVDLNNGALKWTFTTGGAVLSSPALADGIVFFGSQDGLVYAVGPPPPILQISVATAPLVLRTGLVSEITISVTANSVLQSGVSLILTSSPLGTPTLPISKGSGIYVANYTAPLVGSGTAVTIDAAGSKPGFVSGNGQGVIFVEPPSPLTVNLSARPISIGPGSNATLMLQLLNGTAPVAGADITAQSTAGGQFSSVMDLGNGNYTIAYSPPDRDFKEPTPATIMVAASKPGFRSASATAQLIIFGSKTQPYILPELPVVPIAIVGVAVSASALGAYWFKSKSRGEKPRPLENSLAFREALLRSVDSAFELVGANVWKAIMETVENRYGVRREEIPEKLEAFDLGLVTTLGQGASLVERLIVQRLYTELGWNLVPSSQVDFITSVRNAQMEFLSPKKRKQGHRYS